VDGSFEIGSDFGECVGGETDDHDAVARVCDEIVQYCGGQALLADRSGSSPYRA
jgi:hypothetical protein